MQEWSRPVNGWADAIAGDSASGGFFCRDCGNFVPAGIFHQCQPYTPVIGNATPIVNIIIDERIVEALNRIADALEKLVEVEK